MDPDRALDPDPDLELDLELSALMGTSVRDISVPVAVIVAESGRLGRRRKAARRLRTAGAALAVAAVAFAGANAGLPLLGTAPTVRAGAAPARQPEPDPGVPAASAGERWRPLPLPVVSPMQNGPDQPVTADRAVLAFDAYGVLQNLRTALPVHRNNLSPGTPFEADRQGGSTVHLTYTDAAGAAALELALRRTELPFPADGATPADDQLPFRCGHDSGTSGNHEDTCLSGYRPDGSWELVAANDAQVPGLFGYRVAIWRPDGTVLDFTEYAGTVTPEGEPVRSGRTRPPFALTAWRSIAESPLWTYYIS
ncbi:hypothetical protein K353_00620 [Kitasatospora sp. SolWspMP-SS2h]|uniref:hypothetical protein n=1 Tax=Kitasatospora sp. SolWspMP-SS2h TaxID=1305729 RepID=UPI000DBA2042|nr:hypothetical protein [Kitasatospora sp. SolWspMP-SS2h]RAJ46243.1 hypothetical protein K353_00620 [Kitasatospora sp. SolWspMP-SS2h]